MTGAVWTVKAALDWCVGYLEEHADESPRRSAEWLLSAATELSRVELYAYHDRPLSDAERATLRDSVRRRAAGEPLQYVTGEVAFRHIVVQARRDVLIPRPETEVLVDIVIERLSGLDAPVIADACTGTGVVALALAAELPNARLIATDIAPAAAALARENAERLGLAERVTVVEGDLLAPLAASGVQSVDVVVANPPYIPTAELAGLPAEVAGFEPAIALDGGADGLVLFRRLASEAAELLVPGGLLAVELHETRVKEAAREAVKWYEDVEVLQDLTRRDRFIAARRRR